MPAYSPSLQLKLNNVLVATTFSKMAVLYATSIARQHGPKLFVTWRAGQAEITEHIAEMTIDHFVVGNRDSTGGRKFILGPVAQSIFPQTPCPVLTVGSIRGQDGK